MSTFTAKFRYKQNGDAANFDKVFANNGNKRPYFFALSTTFFSDQDSRTKFCLVLEVGEPQLQNVYLQVADEMFFGEEDSKYIPTEDIVISANLRFYMPNSRYGASEKIGGDCF